MVSGAGLTASPRAERRCRRSVICKEMSENGLAQKFRGQHLKSELHKPTDPGIAECSVAGRALMKPIAPVLLTSTAKG